jgi:hypothetical protein
LAKPTGQLAKPRCQLAKRLSASATRLRAKDQHGFALSEQISSKAKLLSVRGTQLRLETEGSLVEVERRVLRSESPAVTFVPLTLSYRSSPVFL